MEWNKEIVQNKLNSILGNDRSEIIIHNERKAHGIYILGFSIIGSGDGFTSRILGNMDANISFHFFDYFHPQLSDPGAYVSIMKTSENTLCYKLGNHGWQSDINSITYERAKRYLLKNIEYNKSPEHGNIFSLNYGEQRPVIDPKKETVDYSRLKDTGRTIQGAKVYELNGSYLLIEDENNYTTESFNLLNKKYERKIISGYYLSEPGHTDFINNYDYPAINNSIDTTIRIKIKKYEPER